MTNRTSTRLRHLSTDHADLAWIIANIGRALERARRDTHPGIAPNGLTADDGTHPGPTPTLATSHAITGDEVRRARDQLLTALDQIHQATTLATHAIHRLLPMRPEDARALAENETLEPAAICANPACDATAQEGRSECRACRAYRHRHGHHRPITPTPNVAGNRPHETSTGTGQSAP
jgi:hypothetical protein